MFNGLRSRFMVLVLGLQFLFLTGTGCTASDDQAAKAGPIRPAELNMPAPSFALTAADGAEAELGDYLGEKTVVIAFWDPANATAVDQLSLLWRRMSDDPIDSAELVSVVVRPRAQALDAVKRSVAENRFKFPVLFDDSGLGARVYGVEETPRFFIVSAGGIIEAAEVSSVEARNWAAGGLYEAIELVASGSPLYSRPITRFCDLKEERAPDFSLLDRQGEATYSLSDYRGKKPVLVVFWSPTCPYCIQELPVLSRYYNEAKGGEEFEFLAVSFAPDPGFRRLIDEYLDSNPLPFPELVDTTGESLQAFRVRGVPVLGVVDKQGIMSYCKVGYRPDIADTLDEVFAKL